MLTVKFELEWADKALNEVEVIKGSKKPNLGDILTVRPYKRVVCFFGTEPDDMYYVFDGKEHIEVMVSAKTVTDTYLSNREIVYTMQPDLSVLSERGTAYSMKVDPDELGS